MKISVAMATYNGAAYLPAQLESIAHQTMHPDELVVHDDVSSDTTLEILRQFAATAPFDVRVQRNRGNLGYSRNFDAAIRACTGDVVFISDQDDVWLPTKIAAIVARFHAPQAKPRVVLNDQWITDASLQPTSATIFGENRRLGFGDDALGAGSCSALSAAFVRMCLPVPVPQLAYDAWIHRVASAFGVRILVREPLQYYRRHAANASRPLLLRGARTGTGLLLREYGLAPMGEKHLLECRILEAIAATAQRAAREAVISETRSRAVAIRAERRAGLIMARMRINRGNRLTRPWGILKARKTWGSDYAVLSIGKDLLRTTARAGGRPR